MIREAKEKKVELPFLKICPLTLKGIKIIFVKLQCFSFRVCVIKSIDGTTISAFCVHECEGSSRMGSRPRRFLFTGHTNGGIQVSGGVPYVWIHDGWMTAIYVSFHSMLVKSGP